VDLNRVHQAQDRIPVRRALVSVADKTGLESVIHSLWDIAPGLEIFSTGGTFQKIQSVAEEKGTSRQLVRISSYTGQPEMQGGLVKTLDYRIYLGLLSEQFNSAHQDDLERTESVPFDLTICNFYPFEATAASEGATIEDLRTHIDIGGPTMLRASAKNFLRVAPICRPDDYHSLVDELRATDGATRLAWRAEHAAIAFRYTAHYEAAIAGALGSHVRSSDLSAIYSDPEEASQ
jgi:phosphoribosylaminoimidazolecarboxamide formyltransferase/IMP cyclohydrolase